MVSGLKVLLFLSLHLLQEVKSSMVHLNNNGYEGVVIAINPSVPEDERLIQSIKEMVTQASTYLFEATKRRFYFRNVSILVPMTWKSKSEYLTPKRESYDQADVIVADPYLKNRDDPYTLQYGQCGDRGQYIHFTPNFLLTDNLPMYGLQGRVFVHEWAHLRWGVFDEYNRDRPFYMSEKNTIEATRCSTHVSSRIMVKECQGGSCKSRKCQRNSKTRLYEPKCTFIPNKAQAAKNSIMFMQSLDSVVEFCTEKTHNTEAPNQQNKMCNYRSTWDVIKKSADFQNSSPMIGTEAPPRPAFSLLRFKQRIVCLVLDKSGSMKFNKKTLPKQLKYVLFQTGTWTYSLFNKANESQLLTVTVTTRARSPTTPPVIVTAHMSQNTARYTRPMIVYARVSQGFLPVLGANVTATIEAEDGHQVTLELWDNGAGADTLKNDGIYSRYFAEYHGNGRYSLKVRAQARKTFTKVNLKQPNKALYVPGYVENGEIIWNPSEPEYPEDKDTTVVGREITGGPFTVSGTHPGGDIPLLFPSSKVTDLEAQFEGDHLHLTWTAPGRILDKGKGNLDAEF
ncbi:LOW QUALITY PROTEIN: calcium-activated chloride channel regulator 3A-1-like [Peromyscus californicus insignis]|uniref:LOW QUALITY PROTEIN: calcium-activated chloride channel regulator 3A-1-like n=1 Tax=Peromyscus californicus insignis TaxID=564181 RepID=UPI0022A788E0|nr:LOW QUALITY PROTEIN: calcium-activated chloride channel regulator 3A-1-like [Peromyscus californicus insignis]